MRGTCNFGKIKMMFIRRRWMIVKEIAQHEVTQIVLHQTLRVYFPSIFQPSFPWCVRWCSAWNALSNYYTSVRPLSPCDLLDQMGKPRGERLSLIDLDIFERSGNTTQRLENTLLKISKRITIRLEKIRILPWKIQFAQRFYFLEDLSASS